MVKVLISLRNAEEAKKAANLPIDFYDFKEPENGSLGSLSRTDFLEARKSLDRGKKISMACGELEKTSFDSWEWGMDVDFFKVGLSGLDGPDDFWIPKLQELRKNLQLKKPFATLVPVFYADFKQANSPSVLPGVKKLLGIGFKLFLIDTWAKNGSSLLNHLSMEMLLELQKMIWNSGAEYGLAGKLKKDDCLRLMKGQILPNWFGFRGAVCVSENRKAAFDIAKASELMSAIRLAQG